MLTSPEAQKREPCAAFGAVGSDDPTALECAVLSAEDDSSDDEDDKPKVIVGEDEGGKKCATLLITPFAEVQRKECGHQCCSTAL